MDLFVYMIRDGPLVMGAMGRTRLTARAFRLTGRSRWPALFRPNEPRSPLSVSFLPGWAVALAAARPAFFRRVQ